MTPRIQKNGPFTYGASRSEKYTVYLSYIIWNLITKIESAACAFFRRKLQSVKKRCNNDVHFYFFFVTTTIKKNCSFWTTTCIFFIASRCLVKSISKLNCRFSLFRYNDFFFKLTVTRCYVFLYTTWWPCFHAIEYDPIRIRYFINHRWYDTDTCDLFLSIKDGILFAYWSRERESE